MQVRTLQGFFEVSLRRGVAPGYNPSMRAFRIARHGGPEVLEWVELPRPSPRADEVLVRVRACAVNHLDLWVRRGVEGHTFPLPLIPGSEVAGIVEEVGDVVRGVEAGQPVLIAPGVSDNQAAIEAGREMIGRGYGILGEHRDGGYAEYVVVPGRNVLPAPRGLSLTEAAAIPLTFLTAWHMLTARAALQPLEDVLVHAAGSGVSTAAIQIARLLGARHIVVTAGSDDKLERARELGATHLINYRREDFVAATRAVTGKKGVEVVFDHVGGDIFEKSLTALAWGGRLVLCGATVGHMANLNLRAVFFKSLSVLGSTMGTLTELRTILGLVEAGSLRPVIDSVYPLARAPEAQQRLERRDVFGKIVLSLDETEASHDGG
jgi:NADPH:quinone reductase-like Zn-dependent oxidoreductase